MIAVRNRASRKSNKLVARVEPTPVRVAVFDDAGYHHRIFISFLGPGGDESAQRGMISLETSAQVPHEVLYLIDGNGIAHARIEPHAFFQRDAAVDADDFAIQ